MITIGTVIEKLGGLSKVAMALGVSVQAVSNMKSRGTFPPKHWPALVREAKACGYDPVTFESLEIMRPDPAEARDATATPPDTQAVV